MPYSKINAFLIQLEFTYSQLNGWKKLMVNALLFAIPYFDLFNDWIQNVSGIGGIILLGWSIIKGWYQVELWKEDLKMKKLDREIKEQSHYRNFVDHKLKKKHD
jgi:hypothetical protein